MPDDVGANGQKATPKRRARGPRLSTLIAHARPVNGEPEKIGGPPGIRLSWQAIAVLIALLGFGWKVSAWVGDLIEAPRAQAIESNAASIDALSRMAVREHADIRRCTERDLGKLERRLETIDNKLDMLLLQSGAGTP